MIPKFLLFLSILFNTFGFQGSSQNLDRQIVGNLAGEQNIAIAESAVIPLPAILTPPKVAKNAPTPNIYAESYLLVDSDSGLVFLKKNETEKVPIASTTKIMTAIVVIENYNLDDVVTVSKEAANLPGTGDVTRTGEQLTVNTLLYNLLIISSNRSANALAEHINTAGESGTAKFVALMNKKAIELGMTDTDYHDPAGLDVTGYSTASDLVIITKYAMKNTLFAKIVGTADMTTTDISGKIKHDLHNSNRLVSDWNYPGAIGVKTGYMPEASHCLVVAVKRDGHTLISIVLHTTYDTATASADESKKLQDWGWNNIIWPTDNIKS
ncbi:MAG: D-alanyl-D-alanine carboxypeptidase [Candidatus Berkelbacteria bacterium]|nr:D-alanyl-D-alanine carboxypeptidase [Candidatus Berkelbacteria bacterium]